MCSVHKIMYNFTGYNNNNYIIINGRRALILPLTYVVDGARSKFSIEFLCTKIA